MDTMLSILTEEDMIDLLDEVQLFDKDNPIAGIILAEELYLGKEIMKNQLRTNNNSI